MADKGFGVSSELGGAHLRRGLGGWWVVTAWKEVVVFRENSDSENGSFYEPSLFLRDGNE